MDIYIYIYIQVVLTSTVRCPLTTHIWAAFNSFWQFFLSLLVFFFTTIFLFYKWNPKREILNKHCTVLVNISLYTHTFNIILINFIYHYKFFDKFICWNSVCLQRQFCSHHNLNGLFARWLSSLSSARANWYHHEDQFAKTYNQTIKIFI